MVPQRVSLSLIVGAIAMCSQAQAGRIVNLATVCLLYGKHYENREYVLGELAKVPAGTDLITLPHMPFLSFSNIVSDLRPFADFARARRTYLALSLTEQADTRTYYTALLFDRGGKLVGRYRKVHALPDDPVDLGDSLHAFATDFGSVGLTIGTDFYIWETYSVLAMKGADIITWHHYPERFRDHSTWEPLLMARGLDSHAHLMTAMYADPRTYITNNWDIGMPGAAWGRSMILNRVGTPIADTGYEDGVAMVRVDLDKRKQDVYWPDYYQAENIFFVNNFGDRRAFAPVAAPYTPPQRPAYRKRTCRLAVVWLPREESWVKEKLPERMLSLIDKAAELKPDLVLFSEMSTRMPDEATAQAIEIVAEKARRYGIYTAIGGVGDETEASIMRVWDRNGREIYQQALYWVKGYDQLKVFDTDFGRVASHECGDLYIPEFDRTLALMGAEIIIDGSQMWGASGRTNETMLRARAADNAVWLACAHWPTSDPSLRSLIIDPYGQVVAASSYEPEGVISYDINLDAPRYYYAGKKAEQVEVGTSGIPSYYTDNMPDRFPGWRDMLFAARRPELYSILPTETDWSRRYRGPKAP